MTRDAIALHSCQRLTKSSNRKWVTQPAVTETVHSSQFSSSKEYNLAYDNNVTTQNLLHDTQNTFYFTKKHVTTLQ